MLSQRTRYALRALLHMVAQGDDRCIHVTELAHTQSIPRKFLELIMSDLKRIGLVTSKRGRSGGYILARPASDIMFAEVIRAMDGPIALVPCASKNFYSRCEDCHDEETCAIRKVMAEVRNSALAILENTSLAAAAGIEVGAG